MNIFPESAGLHGAELIGEGGTGLVYSAYAAPQQRIAVKVAINDSPATRKLFHTEYTLLRSLSHPGIIKLHDFGYTTDNRPYFVMELLSGGDLYSFTDRLAPKDRFHPLGRILPALEYLHRLDIIHRDLKGENVLFDAEHRPRLTDLGLATGCCDNDTARAGTVEYMAPEIIDKCEATPAADIYSLGVMLYRMATGRLPFTSDDPLQIISLKHDHNDVDVSELNSIVTPRFAQLVRRCLDPEPAQRPKSVGDIAEQLQVDGLIDDSDLDPSTARSYLHHYLWAYNVSFIKQEIPAVEHDFLINDAYQGETTRLLDAISDHLQIAGFAVSRTSQAQITYSLSDGASHVVRLGGTSPTSHNFRQVSYAELDRFAFDAILRKLFPSGYDAGVTDMLYRLSGGNMALINLLLLQFEDQGLLNVKAGRITLPRDQVFRFQPSEEYFDAVALMLPSVNEGSLAAVSLFAADAFDNPHDIVVESASISAIDLEDLIVSGILTSDTFQFVKTYYREYFYGRLSQEEKVSLHCEWVALLDNGLVVTDVDLDEQLFYHLAGAGRAEPAAEVAVQLAERFRSEQKPDRARAYLTQAQSLPMNEIGLDLRVKLLMISGDIRKDAGDYDRAISDYARLIRLATRSGNNAMLAEAYKDLGDVYKSKRDYRRGNHVLDHAVGLYGKLGDELELSHCFNNIGNIQWLIGDLSGAAINYETALEVQRHLGARRDIASTLSNLGTVKLVQKHIAEGIRLCEESLAIKQEIGDWPEYARTANNLGAIYYEIEDLQKATDYLERIVAHQPDPGCGKGNPLQLRKSLRGRVASRQLSEGRRLVILRISARKTERLLTPREFRHDARVTHAHYRPLPPRRRTIGRCRASGAQRR